jgi:2,4-dienoyl-CoA reductase-like NADH-dependent reductase (Old Yellow Enzyme family)
MSQYSAQNGLANDWHVVHYGKFAQARPGIVMVETTAVEARGRRTYGDLGLWSNDQVEPLSRVATFIKRQGAVAAIQLGHTGRKGSAQLPWKGDGPLAEAEAARGEAPWATLAPSAIPVASGWPEPTAMSRRQLEEVAVAWEAAARRAARAGFDLIEIDCAHGYLLQEFLSPLSNLRSDGYGGDSMRRMAYPLEIVRRVRAVWPSDNPIICCVSAFDGSEGGYGIEHVVEFAQELKAIGVDLVDCSSGGILDVATEANCPSSEFGRQLRCAHRIRKEVAVATMAVGPISDAGQADEILTQQQVDLIGVAREVLYNPNWPLHARERMEAEGSDAWPKQYARWLSDRI